MEWGEVKYRTGVQKTAWSDDVQSGRGMQNCWVRLSDMCEVRRGSAGGSSKCEWAILVIRWSKLVPARDHLVKSVICLNALVPVHSYSQLCATGRPNMRPRPYVLATKTQNKDKCVGKLHNSSELAKMVTRYMALRQAWRTSDSAFYFCCNTQSLFQSEQRSVSVLETMSKLKNSKRPSKVKNGLIAISLHVRFIKCERLFENNNN